MCSPLILLLSMVRFLGIIPRKWGGMDVVLIERFTGWLEREGLDRKDRD
jgi:hypothetical protein